MRLGLSLPGAGQTGFFSRLRPSLWRFYRVCTAINGWSTVKGFQQVGNSSLCKGQGTRSSLVMPTSFLYGVLFPVMVLKGILGGILRLNPLT